MWKSLKSLFESLNQSGIKYIVLRNQEELLEDDFLFNHSDIDFLCEDRDKFIEFLKSFPREKKNDKIHHAINIDGQIVPIDLRYVGDGYYDAEWEKKMLESRQMFNNLCYVMSLENYYYSLLYHALIQKRKISSDYVARLENMRKNLKLNNDSDNLDTLEKYMKEKGYFYTYPKDVLTLFNIENVDKELIKDDPKIRHKRHLHGLKYSLGKLLWAKK